MEILRKYRNRNLSLLIFDRPFYVGPPFCFFKLSLDCVSFFQSLRAGGMFTIARNGALCTQTDNVWLKKADCRLASKFGVGPAELDFPAFHFEYFDSVALSRSPKQVSRIAFLLEAGYLSPLELTVANSLALGIDPSFVMLVLINTFEDLSFPRFIIAFAFFLLFLDTLRIIIFCGINNSAYEVRMLLFFFVDNHPKIVQYLKFSIWTHILLLYLSL